MTNNQPVRQWIPVTPPAQPDPMDGPVPVYRAMVMPPNIQMDDDPRDPQVEWNEQFKRVCMSLGLSPDQKVAVAMRKAGCTVDQTALACAHLSEDFA